MINEKEFMKLGSLAFEYSKRFKNEFGYYCELPNDDLFDNGRVALEEFKKVIDKCIEDHFDYTIEKYGTRPLPKGNPNDILFD